MWTRLKLSSLLTSLFGKKVKYTTALTPGENDNELSLTVDVLDVALLRHHESDIEWQNRDPIIRSLFNEHHDPSALSATPTKKRPSSSQTPRLQKKTKTAPTQVEPTLTIPSVAYTSISTPLPSTSLKMNVPPALSPQGSRDYRRRRRKMGENTAGDNVLLADNSLPIEELPVTMTGWMGTPFSKRPSAALRDAHSSGSLDTIWRHLTGVRLIPYEGVATRILDSVGRLFIVRSRITENIRQLLPQFLTEARDFVQSCCSMGEAAIQGNRRGHHWFCIAGVDRNNKTVPSYSQWHMDNKDRLKKFFKKGTAFHAINLIANALLVQYFPGIAQRYRNCIDYTAKTYNLRAEYGLFFNWCLNAPRPGAQRVHCDPHVDAKNLAFGICIVFVYGFFNHREKAWLVIWEAGICIELPPGVFLLYPSAIFIHFNVDRRGDIEIVTTPNGEKPTRDNSEPLGMVGDISEEEWQAGHRRGSVVWFNQASMFQTSETGYDTLIEARLDGHSGNADNTRWLGPDGVFTTYPNQFVNKGDPSTSD